MRPVLTLEEVEELIFNRLPGVLERDPHFVTFIEGIVAEKFPRRDEFARLLDEVQQHRMETATQSQRVEERVERVEGRVDRLENRVEHIDQQLQEHRAETTAQFERVDQHFEQVDQRFEQVDQRFEQVDQRFEQVDQRFEQVDQRFEQVDQRFEQVDQRFEQVDQRFAELTQRMEDGFRNVQISIDRLGARWGIRNESIFRQTMREVLEKSFDARVEERVIAGEQFDCVIIDTAHILIEISASVGKNILKKLQHKRQLYEQETGITPARFLLAVGSIHSQRANALRANRRRIFRLWLASDDMDKTGITGEIIALAAARKVPVKPVNGTLFENLLEQRVNHQGVALETDEYPYVALDMILRASISAPLLLILDHIQDPQNLGTLIRTAEAVGVNGLLLPDRRAAGVTPAVSNASAGAVEHLPVAQVTNLNRAIDQLKKQGVWVVGLDSGKDAIPLDEADLAGPLALVVGNEGSGISRLTREKCDFIVHLPMVGQVDSLNAAVAGSIVLYQAFATRRRES